MDATYDVEHTAPSSPTPGIKTADTLRAEIEATSRLLHDHVDELRTHLQQRLDSVRNPWGLRDQFGAQPLAACSAAFVVGAAIGYFRGDRGTGEVVRSLGPTVRSTIAGQVASRLLNQLALAARLF